jgi:hypothetical protein
MSLEKPEVGDQFEWNFDFDNIGPIGPYYDYPLEVEAVYEDGSVDLVMDPYVLPVHLKGVRLSDYNLRPRKGKEEFDAAIAIPSMINRISS